MRLQGKLPLLMALLASLAAVPTVLPAQTPPPAGLSEDETDVMVMESANG